MGSYAYMAEKLDRGGRATYAQMKRVNAIREGKLGKPPIDLDDNDWKMTVDQADDFIQKHRRRIQRETE